MKIAEYHSNNENLDDRRLPRHVSMNISVTKTDLDPFTVDQIREVVLIDIFPEYLPMGLPVYPSSACIPVLYPRRSVELEEFKEKIRYDDPS